MYVTPRLATAYTTAPLPVRPHGQVSIPASTGNLWRLCMTVRSYGDTVCVASALETSNPSDMAVPYTSAGRDTYCNEFMYKVQ